MSVIFKTINKNICNIIINRPLKRNALDIETIKKLQQALERFSNNAEGRVAIIGGAGGNFCAGYDLNEMIDPETGVPNISRIEQLVWPVGSRLSNKITIAAIEGYAAGFGFELALKCDFRVAERDSRMGFMNRRFGVPIMSCGTVILPQLIGYPRALELIATGKPQLAPEALAQGTITHIADIGCAVGKAVNLARCIVKFPNEALMHDIDGIRDQISHSDLLQKERHEAIEFLKNRTGPLVNAVKFLRGELCRHGNQDLGNLVEPSADVTL